MAGETLLCIEYDGARNADGYGVLPRTQAVDGSRLAHRAALASRLGRPVEGVARHTCDNPPCINPDHLVEGTQTDNNRDASERGRAAGRFTYAVSCIHGHPFSAENTRLKSRGDGKVERVCLTCRRRDAQKQAARRKAQRQRKD